MKAMSPIVIHYVLDTDRAKTFYTKVFDVKPLSESVGWTTPNFGGFVVALHILPQTNDAEGPLPHVGLSLGAATLGPETRRI